MFDISIDKATADNPSDFKTFSIIEGGHGCITDEKMEGSGIFREWHDTTDPVLTTPLLTPEIEAELLLIQAEFERLYKRAKVLLMS